MVFREYTKNKQQRCIVLHLYLIKRRHLHGGRGSAAVQEPCVIKTNHTDHSSSKSFEVSNEAEDGRGGRREKGEVNLENKEHEEEDVKEHD